MILDPVGTVLGLAAIAGGVYVIRLVARSFDPPKAEPPDPCSDYEPAKEPPISPYVEAAPQPPHKPRSHHKRPF